MYDYCLKLDRMILLSFILYCYSSTFQAIAFFDALNKVLIAFMCVLILGAFSLRKQPRLSYIILAITALLHVVALAMPVSEKEGIATYFMFAFWVLFWLYIGSNSEQLYQIATLSYKTINITLILWNIITLIALGLPSCYQTGWGGDKYFVSFTSASFEITPVAMFMLAIDIMMYSIDGRRRKALLLAVAPVACVFASGSRTYLAIIVVELIVLLRMLFKKKSIYFFTLFILVISVLLLISTSGIGRKFASTFIETSDVDIFLRVFTNGRSEFWKIDFQAYTSGSFFSILFGRGFSFVYELNQAAIGLRIYAHNDFINVLLNFGAIGLILYFMVFAPIARSTLSASGAEITALFLVIWFFNAFFNMVYVYAAATIAMGVLHITFMNYRNKAKSTGSEIVR